MIHYLNLMKPKRAKARTKYSCDVQAAKQTSRAWLLELTYPRACVRADKLAGRLYFFPHACIMHVLRNTSTPT